MTTGGRGPVLVVVTGHPATGKTSLARHLSSELRLPLVAKDAIKERLFDVLGGGDVDWSHLLGQASMLVLYDQLESLLSVGSSAVAEANFKADLATPELRQLLDDTGSTVVQVVLEAEGQVILERFKERVESGERHPGHPDEQVIEELEGAVQEPYEPPHLPGPLIEVDCTDIDCLDYDAITARVVEALAGIT